MINSRIKSIVGLLNVVLDYKLITFLFYLQIDRLFDLLNSHSQFGKCGKGPLTPANLSQKTEVVNDFKRYINSLKTLDGTPLLMCRRRTFAVGFLTTANSAISLASTLFGQRGNPFKYFLTFKLSQDPIETLFSKIRSMGGFDNNPNVVQFGSAL